MTEEERDRTVAEAIKRKECPFGHVLPGESLATCPLGFPGCGCADELLLNPFLQDLE
jgi:hypothetical protein